MVMVLVMIVLTAAMITVFIDKASTDLIVESRHVQLVEMRQEAYSAMEVTFGVLSAFLQAGNNVLRSPQEGWAQPLEFANWEPPEGLEITVSFEDESGRIPLPTVTATTLNAIFQEWEMSESEAQELTDALLSWMQPNYMPTTAFNPGYERGDLPYAAPRRSLLSYDELKAIDVASTVFYDEEGLPNDLWWKFRNTFSLYSYTQPNLNALPVRPEILTVLGRFDDQAAAKAEAYLTGTGDYEAAGPGFFRNANDAIAVLGAGNTQSLGTQIRALRVFVTVREGSAQYRLSVLITLPNGATTVQSTATNTPTAASGTTAANPANPNAAAGRGAAGGAARGGAPAGRGGAAAGGRGAAAGRGGAANTTLQYPFTVLEIRENIDPIPATPEEENPEAAPATAEPAP